MLSVIIMACVAFWFIVFKNSTIDTVVIWVVTIFTNLVTGITTYYYTKKQTNPEIDR